MDDHYDDLEPLPESHSAPRKLSEALEVDTTRKRLISNSNTVNSNVHSAAARTPFSKFSYYPDKSDASQEGGGGGGGSSNQQQSQSSQIKDNLYYSQPIITSKKDSHKRPALSGSTNIGAYWRLHPPRKESKDNIYQDKEMEHFVDGGGDFVVVDDPDRLGEMGCYRRDPGRTTKCCCPCFVVYNSDGLCYYSTIFILITMLVSSGCFIYTFYEIVLNGAEPDVYIAEAQEAQELAKFQASISAAASAKTSSDAKTYQSQSSVTTTSTTTTPDSKLATATSNLEKASQAFPTSPGSSLPKPGSPEYEARKEIYKSLKTYRRLGMDIGEVMLKDERKRGDSSTLRNRIAQLLSIELGKKGMPLSRSQTIACITAMQTGLPHPLLKLNRKVTYKLVNLVSYSKLSSINSKVIIHFSYVLYTGIGLYILGQLYMLLWWTPKILVVQNPILAVPSPSYAAGRAKGDGKDEIAWYPVRGFVG